MISSNILLNRTTKCTLVVIWWWENTGNVCGRMILLRNKPCTYVPVNDTTPRAQDLLHTTRTAYDYTKHTDELVVLNT